MTLIEFLAKKLAIARKKRQLRDIEAFIGQLEDQVSSGQQALRYWRGKADRLEAALQLEIPPDEICRRAGV